MRQFDAAQTLLDRALQIAPNDPVVLAAKATTYQSEGKFDEAAKQLARIPEELSDDTVISARAYQLACERRFDLAITMMRKETAMPKTGEPLSGIRKSLLSLLGYCEEWAGRTSDARATFERSIKQIKPLPTSIVPVDDTALSINLALSYAGLGDKQLAFDEVRHAIDVYHNDAQNKAQAEIALVQIEARFGELDSVISALPHLLEMPFGVTPALLRIDPMWDPVRNDPRF
jgi:tetratricopeptide (TPR) repeat protein